MDGKNKQTRTVLEVLNFLIILKQSHSGLVYAVLEQWIEAEMTHGMMKCR